MDSLPASTWRAFVGSEAHLNFQDFNATRSQDASNLEPLARTKAGYYVTQQSQKLIP
jgi:hypothetical protein